MISESALKRQLEAVKEGEYECPGCGRRTRDREGACITCRRAKLPRMDRVTDAQLAKLLASCKAELAKRRDALNAALGET